MDPLDRMDQIIRAGGLIDFIGWIELGGQEDGST